MKRDKFSRSPFNVCICYNFPVSKISLQIKIARKSNQVERYVFAITFRYLILNSWFWSIFSHIPKLYCVQNKSIMKKLFCGTFNNYRFQCIILKYIYRQYFKYFWFFNSRIFGKASLLLHEKSLHFLSQNSYFHRNMTHTKHRIYDNTTTLRLF